MPDADAIRATIEQYCARFSARDKEGWLALWADDCTMEDPVGSPLRRGKDEIGAFWDTARGSADAVDLVLTAPPIVVGEHAAFSFRIEVTAGDRRLGVTAIDVMTFDEDARITSQRAYVDMSQMSPLPE